MKGGSHQGWSGLLFRLRGYSPALFETMCAGAAVLPWVDKSQCGVSSV